MAGVVLLVIGLAHLGLYLMLTAGARNRLAWLDDRYGEARLAAAPEPGARPRDAWEVPAWSRAQNLWEARHEQEDHARYLSVLGTGLLASFLVQAAVTGVLLHRSVNRRPHREPRIRSRT